MHIIQWIKKVTSIDGCFLRKYMPFLYHLFLKIDYFDQEDKMLFGERKCFGHQNPDKTFFLIRMDNYGMGLLGYFNCVLGYLKYAQKKGYIPIVDMKNYPNTYLKKEELGKVNTWEYYFNQPCKYTLDDVYQSKNVILSSGVNTVETSPTVLWFYFCRWYSKKRAKKYYQIINNQLKINRQTQSVLDDNYSWMLSGKRVIGVVKRGTDIINCGGHAIQPPISELIDRTKKMLIAWNCNYVFLATEEASTVRIFRDEFGDKLLINQSTRVEQFDKTTYTGISCDRPNDRYLTGLEYLTTVYLLSRCNCLIASLVGATGGALCLNGGKYENIYMYDLGVYQNK